MPRATYALPGQGAPLSRIGGPSLGSTSRQSDIRVSQQFWTEKNILILIRGAVMKAHDDFIWNKCVFDEIET